MMNTGNTFLSKIILHW